MYIEPNIEKKATMDIVTNFLSPLANCKLAITHIHQLPVLRTKHSLVCLPLASINYAGNKARGHVMIVSSMCISEHGVLHQPCDSSCQTTLLGPLSAAPNKHILDALTELKHRSLWGIWLGEIVRVAEHLAPVVSVEVVDCTSSSDDEVSLVAELG